MRWAWIGLLCFKLFFHIFFAKTELLFNLLDSFGQVLRRGGWLLTRRLFDIIGLECSQIITVFVLYFYRTLYSVVLSLLNDSQLWDVLTQSADIVTHHTSIFIIQQSLNLFLLYLLCHKLTLAFASHFIYYLIHEIKTIPL